MEEESKETSADNALKKCAKALIVGWAINEVNPVVVEPVLTPAADYVIDLVCAAEAPDNLENRFSTLDPALTETPAAKAEPDPPAKGPPIGSLSMMGAGR
jgi:hypothetical protein